jgi:hypothetical protein
VDKILDPNKRQLYLEALRPPYGYELDRGTASTFSLDLLTLLIAPLSMVMFEAQSDEDLLKDPVRILEALRRTARKMSIFCQRGRIAIPKVKNLLYSYLEETVVEVQPHTLQGVFHPKTWLLRFVSQDKPPFYRFICLSRNLTFDKSWDTILTLEGEMTRRRFARNRPLTDYIKTLPKLTPSGVSNRIQNDIDILTAELPYVNFTVPNGFEGEPIFAPLGIPGYRKLPFNHSFSKALIISPFVSDHLLEQLAQRGRTHDHILVSRQESLDALKPETLSAFKEVLVLDEAAGDEENSSDLHAKLFLMDHGWDSVLWTGSANATNAAFKNNVEFLVGLKGKRSRIGVDCITSFENEGFRTLLKEYTPPQGDEKTNPILAKLEDEVENACRTLSRADLNLVVTASRDDQGYEVTLQGFKNTKEVNFETLQGKCWPISIEELHARDISLLQSEGKLKFLNLSMVAITSFIAFELTAELDKEKFTTRFVLNLPMQGAPEGRNDKILLNIISNRGRFLRYLMFLLAEGETYSSAIQDLVAATSEHTSGTVGNISELPLLEELVRALTRQPDKIDRIARLVDDIQKSPESSNIIPEGFEKIWQPLWDARKRMMSDER